MKPREAPFLVCHGKRARSDVMGMGCGVSRLPNARGRVDAVSCLARRCVCRLVPWRFLAVPAGQRRREESGRWFTRVQRPTSPPVCTGVGTALDACRTQLRFRLGKETVRNAGMP
jgi:hypothetical protein